MSRLMLCLGCGYRIGNMASGSTIQPHAGHLCPTCALVYLKIKADPLVQMLHVIPKAPNAKG
jgi:hypothetical protein